MNSPSSEIRRPTGPDQPVALGIDRATLDRLQDFQHRYGNIVPLQKPNGRAALFLNDADDVRRLLVRHHTKYRKGPGFERVKMLLGNGLIVSDGDTWRRSRTMIQPAFSRQNVHHLIEVMVECGERRVAAWAAVARQGGALNVTQEMSDFALELILRAIFGPDYDSRIVSGGDNPFAFLSRDSTRDLRVVMQLRELRALLLDIIADRRQRVASDAFDFLSIYLTATDKGGTGFTDEELLDELMTLIVAGYETSAGTLNWAWYLLAGHPEAEDKLLAESRAVRSAANGFSADNLAGMSYAQQLLEETLRLYPPVWLFTRRADQDDTLPHVDLDAGTDIYLSPYILHRTADYWTDPERFDPERFGADSPYAKGERPYFPFSLGPRRCLGEYFSFIEMKVHLALLVPRFRMTRVNDESPVLDLGINLRSQDDIFLRPEIRENS